MAYKIACAIADSRTAPATKVRQNQFSGLAFMYRLVSKRFKYFSDEFAFIDVQSLLRCTCEAESAHLCHTSMIIGSRIPGTLNTFARGRNRSARLTSVNSYSYIG